MKCYRSNLELKRQYKLQLFHSTSNRTKQNSSQNITDNSGPSVNHNNNSHFPVKRKKIQFYPLSCTYSHESYIYLFGDESYMTIPRTGYVFLTTVF